MKNPCRVKGGGTDRVTERRIPNLDQVAALAQAMPEHYRAAVTLAAWGTLRRGEVLGLNREDIDLRAGTVRVERSLHEFYDGRLDSVRRRTATLARCRSTSSLLKRRWQKRAKTT